MVIYKFIAYLHQGENVMALNVNVNSDFSIQEVSDVIRSALALDERLAKHKKARYYDLCKDFETKYKMSSDIFMQKFESGHLDDLDDYFDWYAAKKGFDHWNKKLNILSGISL
ncbi:MAG TPA: hypothetical protein VMV77_00155 [Bacteroidales bacterium]|jgi:hypothetical protein|nr:hypothetical protein [Bacteroidales bacterium]